MIIFKIESVYSHGMATTSKHISKFQPWKEKHGHKDKYWVGFDGRNIPLKSYNKTFGVGHMTKIVMTMLLSN